MEHKREMLLSVVAGALMGAVCFCVVYGIRVLDTGNDGWLMQGGDLSQHYLGWRFYRSSSWHFPLGLMNGILEPFLVSVTYTDSIPLLAIPFKLLSPLLPATFQYFGLWGLLCFMAQGALATLLLGRFAAHPLMTLPGAIVFILSPVMLFRMYLHTALAGHWMILSALCLWAYHDKLGTFRRRLTLWSIQGMLAALIHPYFLPMTVIIAFCAMLQAWLENRRVRENLFLFAAPIAAALITLFLLGAFQRGGGGEEYGLGVYSMNLNGFVNGAGYSYFMNTLPLFDGQGEGFAYIGFGVLLGAAAAGTLLHVQKRVEGKCLWRCLLPLLLAAGIFLLLAVSPRVTLGQHLLWEWPLPAVFVRLLSVFRASGRFSWPLIYLLYAGVFAVILKKTPPKAALTLLSVVLVFQVIDLKGLILSRQQLYAAPAESALVLDHEAAWEEAARGCRHLVLLEPEMPVMEHARGYSLAAFALEHGMTLNAFNVARLPLEQVQKEASLRAQELASGGKADTLYVSVNEEAFREVSASVQAADGLFFAAGTR